MGGEAAGSDGFDLLRVRDKFPINYWNNGELPVTSTGYITSINYNYRETR